MVLQVVGMLHQVALDTLPDAWELMTAPQRGSLLSLADGGATPGSRPPTSTPLSGASTSPSLGTAGSGKKATLSGLYLSGAFQCPPMHM